MNHRVKPGADERKKRDGQANGNIRGFPHPTCSTLPEAAERMIASVAATPWIA